MFKKTRFLSLSLTYSHVRMRTHNFGMDNASFTFGVDFQAIWSIVSHANTSPFARFTWMYIVARVKSTYFQFRSHAFGKSCSPSDATDEWVELFPRVTFRTIVTAAIQRVSSSSSCKFFKNTNKKIMFFDLQLIVLVFKKRFPLHLLWHINGIGSNWSFSQINCRVLVKFNLPI